MRSQRTIRRPLIVIACAIATLCGSLARCVAAPFPGTLTWELRADFPGGVHSAAGGVIDGVLYVSHGFRGTTSAALSRYDPALDAWLAGASRPTTARVAAATAESRCAYRASGCGPSASTRDRARTPRDPAIDARQGA